jgi:L-ribulokinase
MKRYALGLDFGTNSCRSLLVDLDTGAELGSVVYHYPSGVLGVLTDPKDPNLARQNPQDYLSGLESIVKGVLAEARTADSSFDPARILGIGVDTTGSTPLPVDASGTPLAHPQRPGWLWKDHTAHEEAARITAAAPDAPAVSRQVRRHLLLRMVVEQDLALPARRPGRVRRRHSWVEHCDWIPALLTGNTRPRRLARGVCAAGHKAMYCDEWGGLPDRNSSPRSIPALASLRDRLYDQRAVPADHRPAA